jgi:transcriptional regulator with XRE-family HTH domain
MTLAHSETTEHVRTTLGVILRRRRENSERSLAEVAGPARLSPGFLSEVERGLKEISVERLLALCRALETTAAEIYLELATELGAGPSEVTWAVAWDRDPQSQLRRMTRTLTPEALRTVAQFTTFLAVSETPKKRPIGFVGGQGA